MSDLIAPITVQPSFFDPDSGTRKADDPQSGKLLVALHEILVELRVLNASIQEGLNVSLDLDDLRQDVSNAPQ